jgi:flagellar biosynthesis/type III secretory pathway M-ring protein FliF/YscJ
MLKQLENAYLAMLRFVILLTAGLLLIGVVIFGLNALKITRQEPAQTQLDPKVNSELVISDAIARKGDKNQEDPQDDARPTASQIDPHQAYFDRMASAVEKFVNRTSSNPVPMDHARLIQIFRDRAKDVKAPELTTRFVKGMTSTLESALASKKVSRAAAEGSPFEIIDSVLNSYTEHFNQQLDEINTENTRKLQAYQQEKAEGMQSLYYAAAAFAGFLLIVFLSVIIRIERNLRHLEQLPATFRPTGQANQARD